MFTWTDKIKIGDLLYSKNDGIPAIVLDKEETARAKYGDIANKRMRFRLHIDGEQGWLDEVKLRALYRLP
jgi:hypothetical protein|tara:strand:- start:41 stop:250 length:210 start_codon:yes stop_codon:yes gene_type:complete